METRDPSPGKRLDLKILNVQRQSLRAEVNPAGRGKSGIWAEANSKRMNAADQLRVYVPIVQSAFTAPIHITNNQPSWLT